MRSTALVLAPTVLLSSSPEDNKLLRVVLVKSDRSASNCWKSLLEGGQYKCNPWVLDQMEKKLTLERFQREVSNNRKRETNWNQWESLSLVPRPIPGFRHLQYDRILIGDLRMRLASNPSFPFRIFWNGKPGFKARMRLGEPCKYSNRIPCTLKYFLPLGLPLN